MDLFTSMKIFIRVVEGGSLTSAAKRSGISTTMVSKHIRSLETRLAAQLIVRTTRRQRLTDFGRLYFEKCQEILNDVQSLDNAASESLLKPQGTVRVSIPQTFGIGLFMSRIASFQKSYPDIFLDIDISDTVSHILEDGIDIAVRLGNLPDSELIARQLQPYQLMICAAPEYLETHPMPLIPADLAKHDCLTYAYSWSSEWRDLEREWQFYSDVGSETVAVRTRLRVNNSAALRVSALNGMGIAMLPSILIEDDLQAKRLIRILEDFKLPSRPTYLIYQGTSSMLPARLRIFIDFCINAFG